MIRFKTLTRNTFPEQFCSAQILSQKHSRPTERLSDRANGHPTGDLTNWNLKYRKLKTRLQNVFMELIRRVFPFLTSGHSLLL